MSAPSQEECTLVPGWLKNATFLFCSSSCRGGGTVISPHPLSPTEVLYWPHVREFWAFWAFWLLHPLLKAPVWEPNAEQERRNTRDGEKRACPCPGWGVGTGWSLRALPTSAILWLFENHPFFSVKPCSGELGWALVREGRSWARGTKQYLDLLCAAEIFDRAIRITWETVDPFLLSLSRLKSFLGTTCASGIWTLNAH